MYRFTPEQVARVTCLDCNVNITEIGDWYLAASWSDLGLKWTDNLCLDCDERRLGKPLTLGEILPPNDWVKGYKASKRFLELMKPISAKPRKREGR